MFDSPHQSILRERFIEAARFTDRLERLEDVSGIVAAMSARADPALSRKLAQYFTPPDVSLYAASSLAEAYDGESLVFDPSCGKGSLLIAAGFVLAEEFGIRGGDLLGRLRGCELSPETARAAARNIAEGLSAYLDGMPAAETRGILSGNIAISDFLSAGCPARPFFAVANPPYIEKRGRGNLWLPFMDRILRAEGLRGVSAILPVSVSCSDRAQGIRDLAFARFDSISALHHETRPRPLFPNVEQRVTILSMHRGGHGMYETTGFLGHRAGRRLEMWSAPRVRIGLGECRGIFPKISPDDLDFFRASPLAGLPGLRKGPETEIWIRTSGRYSLRAQYEAPENPGSSKWRSLSMPGERADAVIRSFADGSALRWWRIFGDGRDFPLGKFLAGFPGHDAVRHAPARGMKP